MNFPDEKIRDEFVLRIYKSVNHIYGKTPEHIKADLDWYNEQVKQLNKPVL